MEGIETVYHISRCINKELDNCPGYKALQADLAGTDGLGSVDYYYKKCIVDEEWVLEIEDKLPYVGKAIEENRHALQKEGEVVRIDQVKKVSPDSIKHLAQHSNLITDISDEPEELLPKKLYVTENTDNYKLYENRFLYTLLIYLKDFVETRYLDIVNASGGRKTTMNIACDIKDGKSRTKVNIGFVQETAGKRKTSNGDRDMIARIDAILTEISALQSVPLMKMMQEMAPLKLPIVATNIIKANTNFQEAYKLLDYIISYTKPGFETEDVNESINEISEAGRRDAAFVVALLNLVAAREDEKTRNRLERNYLESRLKELSAEDTDLLNEMLAVSNREWQMRIDELNLLNAAQIDAVRASFGDFAEDEHTEADSFKQLAAEKQAFDRYYAQKWAAIKKRARKEYIWDRFKKK